MNFGWARPWGSFGTSGGASLLLPAISNIVAHWDAALSSNMIIREDNNIQYIESMIDANDTGNDLTQETAAEQPIWVPNARNGRGAIQCDNTLPTILKRSQWAGGSALDQPITIASAYRADELNACFLGANDSSVPSLRFLIGKNPTSVRQHQEIADSTFRPIFSESFIGSWVYRVDVISSTRREVYFLNEGVEAGTPTAGVWSGIALGGHGTSDSFPNWTGQIGEVAVWNTAATASEIAYLLSYLKRKWG